MNEEPEEDPPSRYAWIVDVILVVMAVSLWFAAMVAAWRYINGRPL